MKLVPFLTAILVAVFLYFLVIEREAFFEFAGLSQPETTEAEETQETAPSETAEETPNVVSVIARRSEARTIDSAVILRGETRAVRQVELRSETSGTIVSDPLRKGTFVTAGQLMCEIGVGTREIALADAEARLAETRSRIPEVEARVPEAQARIEEAASRLNEAQINLNAAEKLFEGGFASETRVANALAGVRSAEAAVQTAEGGLKSARSGLENIQASILSAEAAVASARQEIEKLAIHAPFEGILESDTAEIGSLMQPGSLCGTIIQLDPIIIAGFVPEAEVNRITEGVRAGARMVDGTTIQGQVSFLSRSADQTTRTFLVEIEAPNADLKIRDGQTADILIEADGALAHLLPQSSLTLNDEGTLGVRIVAADGTAQFTPVRILRDTSQGVWLGGLPPVANVILVGQEYVTDGVPVLANYEETTQ
ncbi:MAG: efflux RND transporter periplasmic adaptor subunit [Paracoccaceae bacterium]|jgi:multidrug efflux system membrane fusion protein|nr:efflux RND transporter periplasmic adaptor subunit [Paracoccaceae bacterium]MDP7186589.1 efflux RND transporter periplasmic adaptor subunit [Paracoccaceae bacterium]